MKKRLLSFLAFSLALAASAQITLLKDINDGSGDSNPNDTYVYNGKAYFQADDASGVNTGGVDYGDELWVSDGTAAGTVLFKNIAGTVADGDAYLSSQPRAFFEYNNSLYFSADGSLFKLNATEDDVERITDVTSFESFCELDGKIYFVNAQGPGLDNVLYVFDGTSASAVTNNSLATLGTEYISINTSVTNSTYIKTYNGKVYFYGYMSVDGAKADTDPTKIGYELYSYDPATGLFELVKDIMPGLNTSGTSAAGGSVANMVVTNGKLYFSAETDKYLYESDGTEAGTIPVASVKNAGVDQVYTIYLWNDKLYFEGEGTTNSIDQLFVFDPVTDIVTELSSNVEENHDPCFFTPIGNDLFYAGSIDNDDGDLSIYKLDGGTNAITLVDATRDLDCEYFFTLNDKLFFEGDDDKNTQVYGTELYVLDPALLSVSSKELTGINSIYPNPATDYITVDKKLISAVYGIYDITGKAVKQGVIESQKIDLRLNAGLYIFKAQTDLGFYAQKIAIK